MSSIDLLFVVEIFKLNTEVLYDKYYFACRMAYCAFSRLIKLSETVYTPSLPEIARELIVSESMVEYTLTIYLFGFAIGTLFWGKLSDKLGRKPCVLAGLFIFIIGCVGCYCSTSINMLMLSRFIQAFGGSIGSVLGQAICRDAFHGPVLGKVYASTGSALAIFPAIGPVVGGLIAENFGWSSIFIFLIVFAMLLSLLVATLLPETHLKDNRKPVSIKEVAFKLLQDKKVIGFGVIVAACNGISFSFFAEGSFYLIKLLDLLPSQYGLSFIPIAVSTMAGGLLSKRLNNSKSSLKILEYGITIMMSATFIFTCLAILHSTIIALPKPLMIIITILAQMGAVFGICMVTSNALAQALVNYKWCIGTAASLFGFFYYCIISLVTFGMGYLHNGTLLPMPLYFFSISLLMVIVNKYLIHSKN